jgi:hypothetical protein
MIPPILSSRHKFNPELSFFFTHNFQIVRAQQDSMDERKIKASSPSRGPTSLRPTVRQKTCRGAAKDIISTTLSSLRLLFVLDNEHHFFKFSISFDASLPTFNDEHLYHWIKDNSCLPLDVFDVKAHPLVVFVKSGDDGLLVSHQSSPIVASAFYLSKCLGLKSPHQTRFTSAATFMANVESDSAAFAKRIGNDFDLVILPPGCAFKKAIGHTGLKGLLPIFDFCSSSLVRQHVKTMPPISIMWFMNEKDSQRDEVLADYMLPFLNCVFDNMGGWHTIGRTASNFLVQGGDPFDVMTNGLVVKAAHGGGGDSNYFLVKDPKLRRWKLDDQTFVSTNSPDHGAILRVEPRVPALEETEYHFYTSMTGVKAVQCTCLYTTITSRNAELNTTTLVQVAMSKFGNMKKKDVTVVQDIIRKALTAIKMYRNGTAFNNMNHLIFRVDMFFTPHHILLKNETLPKAFINEVQVAPSCNMFLDDFYSTTTIIDDIAQETKKFIADHISSWPI